VADTNNLAIEILEAIEEPALVVERGMVKSANHAARQLLGTQMVGRDIRFAIRHPRALDLIMSGHDEDLEVTGIGAADRTWTLSVRPLAKGSVLIRLADRSALRSAERMRTDFVANASHELRTPLATIIGYAETLSEEGPVDDATRERFGTTIEAEARRMLRIVEDLMSLSRIEADRFRSPDEQVDLAEVARIAIENAAPLMDRRQCQITASIEQGMPPVAGDFGQLLQLADNLIGNAIRYGCNDKSCSIEVTVRSEASRIVLIVSDQGDGIAPDHLPRLTERFYRVDSARSRESGGTGLGLAIVKHIVERHRGTLDIRSEPGRGTEVTVAIPSA
jgi:two-component system phosphate regulon sensor histidine kinase PhoR